MASYDILGNIAIIKPEGKTKKQKLEEAKKLLKNPNIETVLEKATNVSGRLRTIKTRYILGEKTKIAKHRENGCVFKFNVETCYFSPRLSNDRKIVSEKIRKKDRVLVMFAGVGVYPIVINKLKNPREIVAVEIGKECCKYFWENLKLNHVNDKIKMIQGDVKKKVGSKLGKFDVIVMARPNLKESFLKYALLVSRKGTRIFYHLFCRDEELNKELDKLKKEAGKLGKKIKIIRSIPVGDIAPYKHRYRVEMRVL